MLKLAIPIGSVAIIAIIFFTNAAVPEANRLHPLQYLKPNPNSIRFIDEASWPAGVDLTRGRDGNGQIIPTEVPIDDTALLDDEQDYVVYGDDHFSSAIEDVASLDSFAQGLEEAERLPLCERTLLIDWGSYQFDGLGSTYMSILQAGVIAHENGYEMLISRDSNNYGKFLDYFLPPQMTCEATQEMYDIQLCRDGFDCDDIESAYDALERKEELIKDHLFVGHHNALELNVILGKTYFWEHGSLSTLPTLSSQIPLAFSAAVPKLMKPHFDVFAILSEHYFRLGADVAAQVEWGRYKIKSLVAKTDVVIGVLYRGGDKLSSECEATAHMSCGNITLHSEAAYESYLAIAKSRNIINDEPRKKPVMILMTIEPGVFQKFQSDPIGRMFDIIEMPTDDAKGTFNQWDFNHQSMYDRVSATNSMLASIEILSLYIDAFIVSANSNLGRVAMLRGGMRRLAQGVKVRPFDIYWFPTLWKVVYPECDGTDNCLV